MLGADALPVDDPVSVEVLVREQCEPGGIPLDGHGVESLHSMIGKVCKKLPTLEIIRDNALLQIGVMQEVAMLRFLKLNAEAIKGTISSLQSFRLAPLSPSRVRRLIGLDR